MMETIGTPNNIEILIHCYAKPFRHPNCDAPAVVETLQNLVDIGAIDRDGEDFYRTTALGDAWVQCLCGTPPPTQVYVDARGRIVGQASGRIAKMPFELVNPKKGQP